MEMMTMTMYFYQSTSVKFIFDSFDVTDDSGYFAVLLSAFILGFLTESLSVAQDKLDQKITSEVSNRLSRLRGKRCTQGILFIMRLWLSYMCMLAVMTYNVGVLFSVIGGLAIGYLVLGFQPAEVVVMSSSKKQLS